MKQDFLESNLSGGLIRDSHISATPPNSYSYALNLIRRDFGQSTFYSNEHSNRLCWEPPATIVGEGYIDERNSILFFLVDGSIHLVSLEDCSSEFVASDTEFGCDWGFSACEKITPEFKVMQPCSELFVYWSSGCEYYWINLEEMLNPKRKAALKASLKASTFNPKQCGGLDCDYFKVFRPACSPKISPYSALGGQLKAGAYQFSVRYKNSEGGFTNWFNISDPIYIGSDHNQAGEISSSSIEINLSGLDCSYESLELGVIETIGGITLAKSIGIFNFSGMSFNYTYFGNEGTPIELSELLIKYTTLPKGKSLIQKDGRMLYYNIKQEKNLDWQREVNNFIVEHVVVEVTLEEAKKYNLKSFMGGENYALGFAVNYEDGTHSQVFHIPCSNTGFSQSEINDQVSTSPDDKISISTAGKYERTRNPIDDTVAHPQHDEYDELIESLLNSYDTEISDICTGLENCEQCTEASNQCDEDMPRVEEIASNWMDILSSHGVDDLSVDFSPTNIKESAERIIEAIRNRERIIREKKIYTTNKSDSAYSANQADHTLSGNLISDSEIVYSSLLYDVDGNPVTEINPRIIEIARTQCKEEEDILYPDTQNCNGEYIYGSLANTKVKHHRFPDRSQHTHFVSKSVGVPSKATPDADEYADGFVRLYSLRVSNISLPNEEQAGKKLCTSNPYTILMVDRTKANRTVIFKGLGTGTYVSSNQGKQYVYQKHGLNSFEKINRFIDISGSRMDPQAPDHDSTCVYSLDQLVSAPALVGTDLRVERLMRGIGFRHHLYALGRTPEDTYYGARIDQRGTCQAINLSESFSNSQLVPISFKIYSPNDHVTAPPLGGNIPLMNRYGQECAWIGANITKLSDRSFVGDVLDHAAPIDLAEAQYVAIVRDLPNQYGDLVGLSYIPIIQAGKNNSSSITAICGDVYIGPYSFVKTSYVSNKVGNKFPISNLVPGKEDRSIKDPADDTIHSTTGNWAPTTLPIELDAADAKNWAGTHTTTISKRWSEAKSTGVTESDYYYPRVLKTLITYWGEFEANPYLRQRGDSLETQYYNNIRSPFYLDSEAPEAHPWEDSYLNQFYVEVKQPSVWAKAKKALIRSILTVVSPMIGLPSLLEIQNGADFIKDLWIFPASLALWWLLNKVLYNNDYLNKLVGIEEPKTDDEGGEDESNIRNFFTNYGGYNTDYSRENVLSLNYFGLPDPYYTCDCDDCDTHTTNQIFVSDRQIESSQLDSYKTVRPNNIINLNANEGSLTNLFIVGSGLLAHTTETIKQIQFPQVAIPTSSGELQMGVGGFLDNPPSLIEGIPEGYAGLRYKHAAINTQYGYFFVDSDANKIYRFSQKQGLEEISSKGVFHFFKEYLPFCFPTSCIGHQVNETSYYSLGVDPRLNRFLITKSDQCGSWTMSYDLIEERWISEHSYIPQTYIWDRDKMYTIKGGLWAHDVKCEFQTFYGTSYPTIVEIPVIDGSPFTYNSTILNTEARICSGSDFVYNRDRTFNELEMWNSWQATGKLNLIPRADSDCSEEDAIEKIRDRSSDISVVREFLQWRLNKIRDYVVSHTDPFLEKKCICHPYQSMININQCQGHNEQTYNNKIEIDNYLVTRLTFSNFTDTKLYIKSIVHYINKQVR